MKGVFIPYGGNMSVEGCRHIDIRLNRIDISGIHIDKTCFRIDITPFHIDKRSQPFVNTQYTPTHEPYYPISPCKMKRVNID